MASRTQTKTRTKPDGARRVGRPHAAQVEAINESIVTAAREYFLAHGYERTSMDAIAARAGVSKVTLYSRYQTKEALCRAIIVDEVRLVLEAKKRGSPRPNAKDLKQRVKQIARGILLALLSDEHQALDRLIRECGRSVPDLEHLLHKMERSAINEIVAEFSEEAAKAGVTLRKPVRLAETLLAALSGWPPVIRPGRAASRKQALDYADQLVDLLYEGHAHW